MKKLIKKVIKIILFLLALLVVVWRIDRTFFNPYIPNYSDQIRNDVTTLKFTVPKDKESCESMGGTWKRPGPRPTEECNLPTKDAGKVCTESKVCEGVCLADLTQEQLQKGMRGQKFKTDGKCSAWIKVLGCRAYVYNGWASVVCVD